MNLSDVVDALAACCDVSDAYVYQLRYALDHFHRHLGREPTTDDLKSIPVGHWIAGLTQSPRTRKNIRNSILRLWRYAASREWASAAEHVRPVKVPKRAPEAWNAEQFAAVARAAARLPGRLTSGISRAEYFSACVWATYETGLRRGDLWTIVDVRAIDAHGRMALTQHKTATVHVVGFTEPTVTRLRTLSRKLQAADVDDWYCPLRWRQNSGQFYYWFNRLRRLAGVDIDRRNRALQHLRRTGATAIAASSSIDASAYLGHTSGPALARDSYIDPTHSARCIVPPNPQ